MQIWKSPYMFMFTVKILLCESEEFLSYFPGKFLDFRSLLLIDATLIYQGNFDLPIAKW